MLSESEYHNHLPSYRSLLNPSVRYDYQTHSLIPLSQNDYNSWSMKLRDKDNKNLSFKNLKHKSSNSTIKMKYKSLLCDVSRSFLKHLSSNITSNSTILIENNLNFANYPRPPKNLTHLPFEIIDYIFYFVDSMQDYHACLFTCKCFYYFAKPYYYQNILFTSTYRMAQFITYLRLNKEVGQYVTSIDLSGIKPGYDEFDSNIQLIGDVENYNNQLNNNDSLETDNFSTDDNVLAGWRDWKFKNNPLYSIHPLPSSNLTNVASHSQISNYSSKSLNSTSSSNKFKISFRYLKRRKSRASDIKLPNRAQYLHSPDKTTSHPLMNKFLLNYSTSKDLPVGYILHLINLCPNIASLNLGNLSLSSDYQIIPNMIYKYQTFDLMNNYTKDLVYKIDRIMSDQVSEGDGDEISVSLNQHNNTSSASSVYSLGTFSKPIHKYNSLLPPLPQTVTDFSYLKKGDGKVYLSDLNLKSINNSYLRRVDVNEILSAIIAIHTKSIFHLRNRLRFNFHCNLGNLKYINLTSMIWLNKSLVQDIIRSFVDSKAGNYDEFSDEESEDEDDEFNNHEAHLLIKQFKRDLIFDFSDSGMYKLLPWAKRIDLNTYQGCKLAYRLVNDILYNPLDEYMRRERLRRGRIGENYLC